MTYRVKISVDHHTWEWGVESYSYVAAINSALKSDKRIPPTSAGNGLRNVTVFAVAAKHTDYDPPLKRNEVRRIHTLTVERRYVTQA